MKKLFLWIIWLLFVSSSAYGLSCAGFPTFDDLVEDGTIVVEGTIEDMEYIARDYEEDFCAQQWGNAVPGTYTYTISVDQVLKWIAPTVMILTREVYDIHCTRWGACTDMEIGKSYTIVTDDGSTLAEWMCSSCPYQEIVEDAGYDPATDETCQQYNDWCNTCSKSDMWIMCTEMWCENPGTPYCIEYVDPSPEPDMCICPMDYSPQCGVDGQTYSNACAAGCDQVEIAYAGECEFGDPDVCDRGYSGPVCGTNGISYEDICDMEAAGVTRAYDGFCVANPNPLNIVDAPNSCTSRYDGCNNCMITNSVLWWCTKRACFQQERSKCVAFEFVYLKPSHEQLIESVISTRLDTASTDDKTRVITKVAEKIDEINYTLSVSSFMQWSTALRNFQFTLEILWKIDSEL